MSEYFICFENIFTIGEELMKIRRTKAIRCDEKAQGSDEKYHLK